MLGTFIPGYRELLEPLLAHSSIDVRGFVSDFETVLRASDVLLLPSIEEGSALVTYAAQGCGCVPVVSDAAGARCTHMVDGMVHTAGDADALTQQLTTVAGDRELLARLREGVLHTARTLTWERRGGGTAGIYAASLERS